MASHRRDFRDHFAGTTSSFPFSTTYVASSLAITLPTFLAEWKAEHPGAVVGSLAALSGSEKPASPPASNATTHADLRPIRQIDAGLLNVGYAEAGPSDGPAVVLLHGWPYDIHSFVDVAPLLAAKGYHVIVPYLRGYGTTHFLSGDTFRNAQQTAVALDIISLMDALEVKKAVIAGFDWGARTADVMSVLWPERCKAIVAVSGYLISADPATNQMPFPPQFEHAFWYQYYFATSIGQAGYTKYLHDFNKLVWQLSSPKWNFDDATYERSAASFTNPDHVAIVIHNYRWRIAIAPGESKYDELEKRLAGGPAITVPAITMEGDTNGAAHLDAAAYRHRFTGKYEHRTITGCIGHNLPQEAPQAFAKAVIDVDGL